MKKNIVHFALIILVIFSINSCNSEKHHTVLKLAHGLDTQHPVHKAMVFMQKRIKELSHNQLELQIYPSGQLGGERQCIELLQIGALAMTKVSSAAMEGFAPKYQVLGLPYIFRNREEAFSILDGTIGQEILNDGNQYWLKGLCYYDAGYRSFYTKNKPIESPDDLKGMKIRVMQSPVCVSMIDALGGSATPINYGELYTALQGGVVDGAENNCSSFYTSHHYEVCKYFSINQHAMIPDVLVMSLHIWDKLSDQEKKWLSQAAKESVDFERTLWAKSEEEALIKLKKAGVQVTYPNQKPFADKVKSVYESFRDQPEVYSLIEEIQNKETADLNK